MKNFLRFVLILSTMLLAGACATPLGQQYGVIGGAGGGVVGGAISGDWRGAAAGVAAGALLGGLLGDHQTFESERNRHRDQDGRHCPSCGRRGYVQPCVPEREPIYNAYGEQVGWRAVCY